MQRQITIGLTLVGAALLVAGCHTDMWQQPKVKAQQKSEFQGFSNKAASRPLVAGTVPRGKMKLDEAFFTGFQDGKLVKELPIQVDEMVLKRGQERFDIFCSHCHGRNGDGKGMINQRGLVLVRPPASYHSDRLRNMPIGHFYDVITNGFGVMYRQAPGVEPADRWAIAAYIRVLQTAMNGNLNDVPSDERSKLEASAGKPSIADAATPGEEKS
ncbi:MAG TPA: cytochrome c [Fimbriimonadaceae bacterium]|nr:cytochrome c [Fimbriimonadaceae bacterium]